MTKPKIVFFFVIILFGSLLNVYYYWDNIWTIWAKHYVKDQDIVISLTTTPKRIHVLKTTLDWLSVQNAPVRQIFLNVPYVYKRDNTTYEIPEWLQNYPNLTIIRTEDYGPATKILGTLRHAPINDHTIIIVVDDDGRYPNNTVLRLAARAKMYPDQAIGISAVELDFAQNKKFGIVKVVQDNALASILEGAGGVVYRKRFFNEDIYEIKNAPDFCYYSDDVFLSFHLAINNVPRRALRSKFIQVETIKQIPFGGKDDSLLALDIEPPKNTTIGPQANRYKLCVAYLHERYPDVVFNDNGIR